MRTVTKKDITRATMACGTVNTYKLSWMVGAVSHGDCEKVINRIGRRAEWETILALIPADPRELADEEVERIARELAYPASATNFTSIIGHLRAMDPKSWYAITYCYSAEDRRKWVALQMTSTNIA